METIQIILIITLFLIMALMMFLRKIPALLALPVMAFAISVIGGVSITDTIEYVIGHGALKLHTAYTVAMFGSMLSVILQKTGVAENLIKKGSELSGDNPWIIAVLMLFLITILFTTLGGLGAIIMVATIVLPIMSSIGIGSMTVVGIFLLGLSIGGTLNVGNWAVYVSVMGLSIEEIRPFALIMMGLATLAALIFITLQLYRDGQDLNFGKIIFRSVLFLGSAVGLIAGYNYLLSEEAKTIVNKYLTIAGDIITWSVSAGISLLFAWAIIRLISGKNEAEKEVHWISYFSPIVPLLLILLFNMDFIAAFIVGLIYTLLATYKKGRLNLFVQSIFEGGAVVMPAVALMFGIGMLLIALMGPGIELEQYADGWPVLNVVRPFTEQIIPTSKWMYIGTFALMAPLALYRGPLNVWGMGYGIAAVFLATGMNPGAVMGLLLSVGQIQGISDPTNTHNVWLANEMQVDVQKVLWETLPYTWLIAILGLIFSALMFM